MTTPKDDREHGPGEEDAGAFLRKGVPGDWRERLDADGVRYIEDACGE